MSADSCKRCGERIEPIYDDEFWTDVCDLCAEIMAERARQRADWGRFHDDPCPEIELTPYRSTKDQER